MQTPGGGDADALLKEASAICQEYKRRLDELAADIEEAETLADLERADGTRREREALVAELSAAYGLGGRPRRVGDLAERARSAVTWCIRSAAAPAGSR